MAARFSRQGEFHANKNRSLIRSARSANVARPNGA
jgi:hypothetical protein